MEDKKSSLNIFGDMNTWDVSKITDMSCLFQWQTNFNEAGDVSNVISILNQCLKVASIHLIIGMFLKVTNMNSMLKNVKLLCLLDKWNVTQVTDISFNGLYLEISIKQLIKK